ncbi:MAG: hypothetical protein AB2A00_26905 [Myxococcota bacterium]
MAGTRVNKMITTARHPSRRVTGLSHTGSTRENEENVELKDITHGPLSVRAPAGWRDITDEVGTENVPFTLARGLGALQLSLGQPQSGPPRAPSEQELLMMCLEIGRQRGLEAPLEHRVDQQPQLRASVSYRADDAFVRLWTVFTGKHFVAASYVCDWQDRDAEVMETELVVSSVRVRV